MCPNASTLTSVSVNGRPGWGVMTAPGARRAGGTDDVVGTVVNCLSLCRLCDLSISILASCRLKEISMSGKSVGDLGDLADYNARGNAAAIVVKRLQ